MDAARLAATGLVVIAGSLTGCPDAPVGSTGDTTGSGTTDASGSTSFATEATDVTSGSTDPDGSTGSTTAGACDPACGSEECCVDGLCVLAPEPSCDPPCDVEGSEQCEPVDGTDRCGPDPQGECTTSECRYSGAGHYGGCLSHGIPNDAQCEEGSVCIGSVGVHSACAAQACGTACDCPPPPGAGPDAAPPACVDLNGDATFDCYLSCERGQTCPEGMACVDDFRCAWPQIPPQPGYRNCSLTGLSCQAGESCLHDGDMTTPPTWAVCSQPGCTSVADCVLPMPLFGDAILACGDPTSSGIDGCYLDCSFFESQCPPGMTCVDGMWCAWPAGTPLLFDDFQTGDLSMGWTVVDGDMNVPHATVSFIDQAWVVSDAFDGGPGANLAAYSTSLYDPPGTADDWLVTPSIAIGPNAYVEWWARAQDPAYRDGYEVWVSTAGPDIADFDPLPIFSTSSEAALGVYVYHRVDLALAGYADQTIHLAWHNDSSDRFVLLVDDVAVVDVP